MRPGKGFSGITLTHNVRKKEEVAKVLTFAEKAGGKIEKPAQDVFWGGHSGYFSDPDGYYWEVAWAPNSTFDEHGHIVVSERAEPANAANSGLRASRLTSRACMNKPRILEIPNETG